MSVVDENEWGVVSTAPLANNLEQLIVHHKNCQARVSLYGGQVLAWQPTGKQDVFWLSDNSHYQQGKAIRGGVPLCWPWFGAYKEAGNHGFVRQAQWQLINTVITEQTVELVLLWQGEQMHALWPHKAQLIQTLTLGDTYTQTVEINNLSDMPFEYTGALHSYFQVSDPAHVDVDELNHVSFDCKITHEVNQHELLENCCGPIDRIYNTNKSVVLVDHQLNRKISIEAFGTHQWVLWNPGAAIAASMTDVHQGGEQQFVCLEAAETKWQTVQANSRVRFGQKITVLS